MMSLRSALVGGLALLLAGGVVVRDASAGAKPVPAGKAPASSAAKARVKGRHSRRREPGQKTPTPDRISEIQQALAKDGSFANKPNGKWDASTVEAMRKFQAAHGLNPTGKLDALTLQKLGLGSKTAGVAAPMPTASSGVSPSLLTSEPSSSPRL
jgi:peptidoglycan hydrolase-like protein with peptidoglycan-binding domain